jgi:hypothetical protein
MRIETKPNNQGMIIRLSESVLNRRSQRVWRRIAKAAEEEFCTILLILSQKLCAQYLGSPRTLRPPVQQESISCLFLVFVGSKSNLFGKE